MENLLHSLEYSGALESSTKELFIATEELSENAGHFDRKREREYRYMHVENEPEIRKAAAKAIHDFSNEIKVHSKYTKKAPKGVSKYSKGEYVIAFNEVWKSGQLFSLKDVKLIDGRTIIEVNVKNVPGFDTNWKERVRKIFKSQVIKKYAKKISKDYAVKAVFIPIVG